MCWLSRRGRYAQREASSGIEAARVITCSYARIKYCAASVVFPGARQPWVFARGTNNKVYAAQSYGGLNTYYAFRYADDYRVFPPTVLR